MENSNQRAASIDTSKLFVRKQDDKLKKDEDTLNNVIINAVAGSTTFDVDRIDQTEISKSNEALSSSMYIKDNLKQDNDDINTSNDNIEAVNNSDLKIESDSFSDNKLDTMSVLKSLKTEDEQRVAKDLAHEEAVYYEIDKLFNQLMALNLEIKAATER